MKRNSVPNYWTATNVPLRLTPLGVLFREQAAQILGRVEDMRTMMERAISTEWRRFTGGFVASTMYARLSAIIRQFRAEAPKVELSLLETSSLDQIAALKEGRIDVGFGRIRFEDAAVRRTVLREEKLVAAVAAGHGLASRAQPVPLYRLAEQPLVI